MPPNAALLPGGSAEGALPTASREASNLLEALDDAMFAAIAGNAASLGAARDLWTAAVKSLAAELVDESREQYLRYAVEMTQSADGDENRDPTKAVAATEIIALLTAGY
jgi:hypothetical protein